MYSWGGSSSTKPGFRWLLQSKGLSHCSVHKDRCERQVFPGTALQDRRGPVKNAAARTSRPSVDAQAHTREGLRSMRMRPQVPGLVRVAR